jgi:hypothetical protein
MAATDPQEPRLKSNPDQLVGERITLPKRTDNCGGYGRA